MKSEPKKALVEWVGDLEVSEAEVASGKIIASADIHNLLRRSIADLDKRLEEKAETAETLGG